MAFRDHPVPPIEFLKGGGDPFHDLAVHDIDFVLLLLGEQPTTVTAAATSVNPELRAAGVLDTAMIMLQFPGGTLAKIDMSRLSNYGYDQRIEVFSDRGRIETVNSPELRVRAASDAGASAHPPAPPSAPCSPCAQPR